MNIRGEWASLLGAVVITGTLGGCAAPGPLVTSAPGASATATGSTPAAASSVSPSTARPASPTPVTPRPTAATSSSTITKPPVVAPTNLTPAQFKKIAMSERLGNLQWATVMPYEDAKKSYFQPFPTSRESCLTADQLITAHYLRATGGEIPGVNNPTDPTDHGSVNVILWDSQAKAAESVALIASCMKYGGVPTTNSAGVTYLKNPSRAGVAVIAYRGVLLDAEPVTPQQADLDAIVDAIDTYGG